MDTTEMLYPLVKIPAEHKEDFFQMNKKEAQAYFDWFMSIKDDRLNILSNHVKTDHKEWQADFTRSSLTPLFEWFSRSISQRPMTSAEISHEEGKIKGLLKGHIDVGDKTFTDESVSVCFDAGIYFAETLRKNIPGMEWTFVMKPKRYVYYAQPIIEKPGMRGSDFNGMATLEVVARKVFDNRAREDELIQLYDVWTGLLK